MRIVKLWRRFELADDEPDNLINDEGVSVLAAENENLFQPQVFQQVADYLRDRAEVLEASAIDPETERGRLQMYVHWLERCVVGASEEAVEDTMYERLPSRGGNYFKQLGRHARYFSDFFVKVIFFTMDIRNDGDSDDGSFVNRTFRKAIRLLPPQIRSLLEEMYSEKYFPSPATMSRASLFLDVAFMRLMADRHELLVNANSIFFGLTDASPIGGRLYQVTEYFVLGGDDPDGKLLLEAGAATSRLRSFPKRPEEVTEQDLAAMDLLMDIIREAKSLHCFVPMCMDSRNSSGVVRSHCIVQQARVESHTWDLTAKLLALFFSFTIDRGPEAGLRRLYMPTLNSFAYWRPIAMDVDSPECLGEIDGPEAPGNTDPVLSLTHIVDIAGTFHAIDNIEKRMLDQLQSYKDNKQAFGALVICFHRPYLRKRFLYNCIPDADRYERDMFTTTIPNLDGGRAWLVMAQLTNYFGERERLIRSNLDPEKMATICDGENEGEHHEYKDTSVQVLRATDGINSPTFWSMVALVRIFANWLAALMYWVLGCPCHPRKLRDRFQLHLDSLDCPLRTCRAPDIAAGDFAKFNERLCEEARASVVIIMQRIDLNPNMKARVMDEFTVGGEYINVEFSIRITIGWQGLPLRALVAGHENIEVVIDGLVDCLMQFEAIRPEDYAQCAPITLQLFGHGSALREQILCVVQRTRDIDSLPGLSRFRIGSQHAPVAEQSIERRHALTNAAIRATPNHSVAFDSVRGVRKRELCEIFEKSPSSVQELAKSFDKHARTPAQCLLSLGLEAHPTICQYAKESGEGLGSVPHNEAADVIYRADFTSQSQRFADFEQPPLPPFLGGGANTHDGALLSNHIFLSSHRQIF